MKEQLDELQKIIYGWIVARKNIEDLEYYQRMKQLYDL